MIRYLTLTEVLDIHKKLIAQSGGRYGIRDWSGLESALAQPKMTFDQRELYPSIHEKAATLAFSLIQNHPFIDGNKRVAHAVMEIFLLLNGFEIQAEVDEQEKLFLSLASGKIQKEKLADWLQKKNIKKK